MDFLPLACTCEKICVPVWPPNAILYKLNLSHLWLVASQFGQDFINGNISFFLKLRLRNGATYKSEDGTTALYLNGNGSYAKVPAVNFSKYFAFTIMWWLKVLEPAKNPGYIFAPEWSPRYHFSIWVHVDRKKLYIQLIDKLGQNILSMYTG